MYFKTKAAIIFNSRTDNIGTGITVLYYITE